MAIKAIETEYNGYRFRSRLEARWAVFFGAMGIEYRYEHEGFDLDGIWYLPDFWLPQFNCYGEVKPEIFTWEQFALCYAMESPMILLDDWPEIKGYYTTRVPWPEESATEGFRRYLSNDEYGRMHFVPSLRKKRLWFLFGESVLDYWNDTMEKAIIAARQARFEHGERI